MEDPLNLREDSLSLKQEVYRNFSSPAVHSIANYLREKPEAYQLDRNVLGDKLCDLTEVAYVLRAHPNRDASKTITDLVKRSEQSIEYYNRRRALFWQQLDPTLLPTKSRARDLLIIKAALRSMEFFGTDTDLALNILLLQLPTLDRAKVAARIKIIIPKVGIEFDPGRGNNHTFGAKPAHYRLPDLEDQPDLDWTDVLEPLSLDEITAITSMLRQRQREVDDYLSALSPASIRVPIKVQQRLHRSTAEEPLTALTLGSVDVALDLQECSDWKVLDSHFGRAGKEWLDRHPHTQAVSAADEVMTEPEPTRVHRLADMLREPRTPGSWFFVGSAVPNITAMCRVNSQFRDWFYAARKQVPAQWHKDAKPASLTVYVGTTNDIEKVMGR